MFRNCIYKSEPDYSENGEVDDVPYDMDGKSKTTNKKHKEKIINYLAIMMFEDGTYNCLFEINAINDEECVKKAIIKFDKEMISGENSSMAKIISYTVENKLNNKSSQCYLKDYFNNCNFTIVNVVDGKMVYKKANKITACIFDEIDRQVNLLVKKEKDAKDLKVYKRLQKQFGNM